MLLALAQAREAAASGEVPIGAVVVKDGKVVETVVGAVRKQRLEEVIEAHL